eukprot:gene37358-50410_t
MIRLSHSGALWPHSCPLRKPHAARHSLLALYHNRRSPVAFAHSLRTLPSLRSDCGLILLQRITGSVPKRGQGDGGDALPQPSAILASRGQTTPESPKSEEEA